MENGHNIETRIGIRVDPSPLGPGLIWLGPADNWPFGAGADICKQSVINLTFDKSSLLQRGGQPPRDLTGLVEELVLTEAEENVWGTQFRSFLKQRDKSLEHALDFVTLSSRLSTVQDQAK